MASLVFLVGYLSKLPVPTARALAAGGSLGTLVGFGLAFAGPPSDANIGAGLILLASVAALCFGLGGLVRVGLGAHGDAHNRDK